MQTSVFEAKQPNPEIPQNYIHSVQGVQYYPIHREPGNVTHSLGKRQSIYANSEMTQMLKLSDKDCKVTIINALCLVAQLCLTLCDSMDHSPPGFSSMGFLQARILEWVAMPSSKESFPPKDRTQISGTAGRFFTTKPPGKPTIINMLSGKIKLNIRLL